MNLGAAEGAGSRYSNAQAKGLTKRWAWQTLPAFLTGERLAQGQPTEGASERGTANRLVNLSGTRDSEDIQTRISSEL